LTILEPASAGEVAAILAGASRDRKRILIRGAGTKLTWGEPVSMAPVDLVLSTAKLNRVLAHRHGDLTATVEAGATLADVNRTLATHGQWLPLDPPWADRCTIGGLVATNDSGPRRHRYGAPRDLIIGIDIVRADGVAAKAGGIVVKNVAGYDLGRLMTGSFGSLAVIVSATFKLYPLPAASRTVVVEVADVSRRGGPACPPRADTWVSRYEIVASALLGSQLTPTAVEIEAPTPRLLVRFETTEVAAQQQADAVVALANASGATSTIVAGDEEAALWAEHARRPWVGDGAVVKITLLPGDIASTLTWLAEATQGCELDAVGRAGVGVLLARIGGDVERQVRVLSGLRERLPPPTGGAVLVRASDDLKSRVDPWGPLGGGLGVMRAIKRQFDAQGILNPGRGPGGL
jgi:glycolate dehydrogenase FAD-binding subunit